MLFDLDMEKLTKMDSNLKKIERLNKKNHLGEPISYLFAIELEDIKDSSNNLSDLISI